MTPRPDLKSCCDGDKKNGWADELEELVKRNKFSRFHHKIDYSYIL